MGGFLGAATSGAGGRRLGTGGAVILAHAVTTVGVLAIAAAGLGTTGWAAAALLGLGQLGHGFAIGFSNSHEMSFQQALTPDAFQARMNITKRSVNRAMIVVFAPLGGLLAVQTSNRVALLVAAVVFGLVVLALLASPFRSARTPTAEDDP